MKLDLDVHQCNLRQLKLTEIPAEVGQLRKPYGLYLGWNAITRVSPELGKLGATLRHLELGPNPLSELPGELFEQLADLRELDLPGTQLTALPDQLAALPLTSVTLHDNPQLDVDQALAVLGRIPTLRRLCLSNCGLKAVPAGLERCRQLERLTLNDNEIRELPEWLSQLKLEILAVMANQIEVIPDALEPRVRNIYFRKNPGMRREKRRLDAVRKGFVL